MKSLVSNVTCVSNHWLLHWLLESYRTVGQSLESYILSLDSRTALLSKMLHSIIGELQRYFDNNQGLLSFCEFLCTPVDIVQTNTYLSGNEQNDDPL